uniref:Uncharacterized protein n=1 Tax=Fusarium oxysporum (strain Fo5176) TaxID=660025 RepID=A0A0D2Y9W6_FUSOF
MSTHHYLNPITAAQRFMPYELGRQFQRFHDDHPELLTMLTEEDWRWIIEVYSKTKPQPGEERHPDEWTGSTESISSVLPRWHAQDARISGAGFPGGTRTMILSLKDRM